MSDWKTVMRIRSTILGVALGVLFIASTANARNLCTRLPLSYLGADEAEAAAGAREKLKQYAIEELGKRGWSGEGELTKREEIVSCKPYFSIGPISTGQRCRVTATFCVKSEQVTQAKASDPAATIRPEQVPAPRQVTRASPLRRPPPAPRPNQASATRKSAAASDVGGIVRLRLRGSSYQISGVLKKYDKLSYVIAPPDSQNITVPADKFDCVAGACPRRAN